MALSLKAARVNAGYTQLGAGKKLGVSKETISNWERSKSYPPMDKLMDICNLYKVKLDDLIFLPSNNA